MTFTKIYKLKKKYPGLPQDWETGMTVGVGDRKNGYSPTNSKYKELSLDYTEVQDPEYWEACSSLIDDFVEPTSFEWRMYFLVMYNISPIQQGIQALHACQEYNNAWQVDIREKNGGFSVEDFEPFEKWSTVDKTVILLNGGSSQTMVEHNKWLQLNGIKHSYFLEPDLNMSMSAISFLVDERVWNKEKYPDLVLTKFDNDQDMIIKNWERKIGQKNVDLRAWLKQFRLA